MRGVPTPAPTDIPRRSGCGARPGYPFRRRQRLAPVLASAIVFGALTWAGTSSAQTSDASGEAAPADTSATQATIDPNAGNITFAASMDLFSKYMFRGIRQHSTGVAFWPYADVGLALHSGEGRLKSVGVNFGTWNSLHTGDTGNSGPSGKLWYESDFYATVGFGFGGGVSLATTYTAYTSPNNTFTSVKEIAVKLAVDDSAALGRASLKPYGLVAFELDTDSGVGQADGGLDRGTYLEFGVSPGLPVSRASVGFPVKVGLSLDDYYELDGEDHPFGFFSVGSIVTVPLNRNATRFGSWNVHGGVEFLALGETTEAFNGGDSSRFIGSIGLGLSY